MLRCLRRAKTERDSKYRLSGLIKVNDAVGRQAPAKQAWRAEGKTPMLLAAEHRGLTAAFATAGALARRSESTAGRSLRSATSQ